ncbi:MAG: zinc ABC transporter substrate-binding protein [Hyphomicrobiaceae bacterium]|nr:zinc ABC transporter substrate-binding protein [Hyphomicrobiaceae bacterium]
MTAIRNLPLLAAAGLLLFPGAALADLDVVVTSKPIHALVSSVMAGIGTPGLLVDGQASPHSYAMKPSDARKVQGADVLFRVSEEMEPFTGKVVGSLPSSVRVVSLAETPGLKLLERREAGAFDAHRGHGGNRGHAPAYDPHVWLDPDNARAMVAHIAGVLAGLAPDKAAAINANAESEIARIAALSSELARELAPLSGKPFIVHHDAYQYLERRYGLSAVGSVTAGPDLPPGGKRLQELRRKIAGAEVLCVFAEPHVDARAISAVVEGTAARAGTLDPEGVTLAPGPDLYQRLMRNLARDLKACLADP